MARAVTAIRAALRHATEAAMGLWFPPVCGACESAEPVDRGLCETCHLALLDLVAQRYCPLCGTTTGAHVPVWDDGCRFCPQPLNRWDRLVRLGSYAPPIRQAVQQLKYRGRGAPARRMADLLAEAVATACTQAPLDVVVPVPMHWLRRIRRGQNHAAVLAGVVARRLALPTVAGLVRVRNTPPQVHLARTARQENIRRAFAARRVRDLAGAHVLLVDDVTTTGATANEATRTLLQAGAVHVTLAVLAKVPPPQAYAEGEDA